MFGFKTNKRYFTLLFTYMGLAVILIVLIYTIIYNYFYNTSIEQTKETNAMTIALLKKEMDSQIKFMDEIALGLKGDYEMLSAIMQGSSYDEYKLAQKLNNYTSINPDLLDIVVFDFSQDKAYCSSGATQADRYFEFYTQTSVDIDALMTSIQNAKNPALKGFINVRLYKNQNRQDAILYITPLSLNRKILFLIKKDIFYAPVENVIGELNGTFFVTDSNQSTMISFDINNGVAPGTFLEGVSLERRKDMYVGYTDKNMIVASGSDVSGFIYCIVSESALFDGELAVLRTVFILSIVMLLVIGLVASLVFARITYTPIKRLKRYVMGASDASSFAGRDDLDIIKSRFEEIRTSLDSSNKRLSTDKAFLRNSLICGLVSSTSVYYTNHDNYLREGIVFPYRYFCVLVLQLEEAAELDSAGLAQEITQDHQAECYISAKNEYGVAICLINSDGDQAFEEVARRLCRKTHKEQTPCLIGVGECVDSTNQIRQSFIQALTALSSKEAQGDERIRRYSGKGQLSHNISYLNTIKPKLAHAINACDMVSVEGLIGEAFDNTAEHTQHIFIYSDLMSQLMMMANAVGFSDETMNSALYYVYQDKQSMMDGYLFFARMFCQFLEEMKSNTSTQLLEDVREYIAQNYSDKNLCVQSVADYFKVSSSYLNKYLKEVAGETVFSMLDNQRMESAKRALRNTNLQIKDIVDISGYGDINYFTKKFKKMTGLTPTQYRNVM